MGVAVERLTKPAGGELEADTAPGAAALEHEQVAAVGIDVHQVGVQRADAQGGGGVAVSGTEASPPWLPTCSSVAAIVRVPARLQPGGAPLAAQARGAEAVELDQVALPARLERSARAARASMMLRSRSIRTCWRVERTRTARLT